MATADGALGPDVDLTRYNAFGTLGIAVRWARGTPILVALFLAAGAVTALGGLSPALALLACLLTVFAAGVAHLAAARFVADERLEWRSITATVARRFPALLVVTVLYGIAVGVGLALFVLPGLYLLVRLWPALPACVVDGRGPLESLAAGWRAGSGGGARKLAGVVLLAFGLYVAVLVPLLAVDAGRAVPTAPIAGAVSGQTLLAAAFAGVTLLLVELAVARCYLERTTESVSSGRSQ